MPADPFALFGTRQQLATVLGLSLPRLSQLTSLGILSKPTAKGINLAKAVQAYVAYIRRGQGTLAEEQKKLITAKRRREELRLRREQGELVELDAAKQESFQVGRRVRDVLLNVPDRLAGIVSSESDQSRNYATLLSEMHQACEELSRWCLQTTHTLTPPTRPTRARGMDNLPIPRADLRVVACPRSFS